MASISERVSSAAIAPVGVNARLAKLHLRGEAGGAQHLPQVRRETLVAIPAQLPLLDAAFDRVADAAVVMGAPSEVAGSISRE
jgi:hypothetical protein